MDPTSQRQIASVVAAHNRAVRILSDALDPVAPADLTRATPCAGWTLADLLAHEIGQQRAFLSALDGGASEIAGWAPVVVDDPVSELRRSGDRMSAAVSAFGSGAGATIWMPEILPTAPLPAVRALGARFVDLLVHAWDIAAALGDRPAIPDDLAAVCLAIARSVPDDAGRERPGAAFAHALPVADASGAWDESLRLFGRDPGWRPPVPR